MKQLTIIIPTYKRHLLLKQCLHSLIAAKPKKFSLEILVLDDESSRTTKNTIKQLRKSCPYLHYYPAAHLGPGLARNIGLEKAKGEFIVFLDDDCLVPSDWFIVLEKIMKKNHSSAAGGSISNPTNSYIAWSAHLLNFSEWLPSRKHGMSNNMPSTNALYRSAILKGATFVDRAPEEGYGDSLFNHQLREQGHIIWFYPELKVAHLAWENNKALKIFFEKQKKAAKGFVNEGFMVHGFAGKALRQIPLLNLLCPRLLFVFLRCARYGELLRFLWCFPLMLAGEFYRGLIIIKTSVSANSRHI